MIAGSVYMFVLLYVHLTNVVTYPHCFLTAKKAMTLPVLAGMSDSKNPDLSYNVFENNFFRTFLNMFSNIFYAP